MRNLQGIGFVLGVQVCLLVSLAAGYSGGDGSVESPYAISSVADWQELTLSSGDWDQHFVLTQDIDFEGLSLIPIARDTDSLYGFQGTFFTGNFNGQGYVLRNAVINLPSQDCVGLFGGLGVGGQLLNLGVENISVVGRYYVGGLVGLHQGGRISKCFTTGSAAGKYIIGGLGGRISASGTVTDSYSACVVSGIGEVGGMAGELVGEISGCYAAGDVIASDNAGGLVGWLGYGFIQNCYATGHVSGYSSGGLVGFNKRGKVLYSYSTGRPTGGYYNGGLCGDSWTGYQDTGNFWDTETSGKIKSAMGTGKTTAEMKTQATFTAAGWDFVNVWAICEGTNYPRLRWHIPAGDWVCPDGVRLEDLDYLAARWLLDGCAAAGGCDGADLDGDGAVTMADMAIFAEQWMR